MRMPYHKHNCCNIVSSVAKLLPLLEWLFNNFLCTFLYSSDYLNILLYVFPCVDVCLTFLMWFLELIKVRLLFVELTANFYNSAVIKILPNSIRSYYNYSIILCQFMTNYLRLPIGTCFNTCFISERASHSQSRITHIFFPDSLRPYLIPTLIFLPFYYTSAMIHYPLPLILSLRRLVDRKCLTFPDSLQKRRSYNLIVRLQIFTIWLFFVV